MKRNNMLRITILLLLSLMLLACTKKDDIGESAESTANENHTVTPANEESGTTVTKGITDTPAVKENTPTVNVTPAEAKWGEHSWVEIDPILETDLAKFLDYSDMIVIGKIESRRYEIVDDSLKVIDPTSDLSEDKLRYELNTVYEVVPEKILKGESKDKIYLYMYGGTYDTDIGEQLEVVKKATETLPGEEDLMNLVRFYHAVDDLNIKVGDSYLLCLTDYGDNKARTARFLQGFFSIDDTSAKYMCNIFTPEEVLSALEQSSEVKTDNEGDTDAWSMHGALKRV